MGLTAKIFAALLVVVLVLAGISAYLYFTDYGVEAKITDKGSDAKGNWIEATTVIGGFKIRQYLNDQGFAGIFTFNIVQKGNFVVYNIQSGHLRMWQSESDYRDGAKPIYDSG